MIINPYKQQERMLQLQHVQGNINDEVEHLKITTRSNRLSQVCVAFSRSKRKTIIVEDQTTLTKNKLQVSGKIN